MLFAAAGLLSLILGPEVWSHYHAASVAGPVAAVAGLILLLALPWARITIVSPG
jgi:hypothetical protein